MKIVRKLAAEQEAKVQEARATPWKVLVVDDEPDVRRLTALNLRGFQFAGRSLELIEAASCAEAKEKLQEHGDIAMALIDVVMENDEAGLQLVKHIRTELKNYMMRLVIRTGQPGVAPERFVIDNFDIDDYKDKTELTAQKLYTTMRSALKSYRDLQTIEMNRKGLAYILEVTPELYNLHLGQLEDYFRGVLTQMVGICNLGHSGMISTIDGLVATMEGRELQIRAGIGDFGEGARGEIRRLEVAELCSQVVLRNERPEHLRQGAMIVPLKVKQEVLGFIYIEAGAELSAEDRELVQVMANQCAAALDNFRLHHSLEESYEEVIDMLALVAEFKDSATGTHIHRIQEYTRRTALALGCSEGEAAVYAKASRLHDVGKVGIPDQILRKPGKLTPEEYTAMKRHAQIGDTILSRSPTLAVARVVARSHHERWDGTGYPDGLSGESIPYSARIVAVADVFDALVSVRPYKDRWDAEKAAAEIEVASGKHFEPRIAAAFLEMYRAGDFSDLIEAAHRTGDDSNLS